MKIYRLESFDPQPVEIAWPLVVHSMPGWSTRLVVSLAGVGKVLSATPPIEFLGTASQGTQNHVLYFSDNSRSWMNGPGIADTIRKTVTEYCETHGITEIVTLGNSMGGFAAIVLAEMLPVDTVIAFSPQFSAHPDIVPEETRWGQFREAITSWEFMDVGEVSQPETRYFILHGDAPREAAHWMRFPQTPQMHHFIFRDRDHALVRTLQKRNLLARAISAAIAHKPRQMRKALEREMLGRTLNVLRREHHVAKFPNKLPRLTARAELQA